MPGSTPVRIEAEAAVLSGEVVLPPEAAHRRVPGAVVVHGSGRMTRGMYGWAADRLVAMGVAALVYDKRGVGQSTGRYRDVTTENSPEALAELADDARRALAVLSTRPEVDAKRVGMLGNSQAGWILPLAADRRPEVAFLVILSGPAVSVGLEIRHGRLNGEGSGTISDEELAKQLAAFRGPHGYDPAPTLRRLRTPTLWIMGDRDQNLPLRETLEALEALPAKASGILTLVRYAQADHQLRSSDGSRADYWGAIESWLRERGVLGSAGAASSRHR